MKRLVFLVLLTGCVITTPCQERTIDVISGFSSEYQFGLVEDLWAKGWICQQEFLFDGFGRTIGTRYRCTDC